jgi:RimJ/RimL family protein N-acetyltransferase
MVADVQTPRLDLIATMPAFVQCEKDALSAKGSAFELHSRFESLVRATVPAEWPPQDWEPHVLDFLLKQMAEFPGSVGWARLVALRESAKGSRVLIGTVGAVPPGTAMSHSAPGEIEVGYGILPAFQRQGFATEALAGMMEWVQSQATVTAFVAQTFPHLQPSIRVLEKSGFERAGSGFEEETILFRRVLPSEHGTMISMEKT